MVRNFHKLRAPTWANPDCDAVSSSDSDLELDLKADTDRDRDRDRDRGGLSDYRSVGRPLCRDMIRNLNAFELLN